MFAAVGADAADHVVYRLAVITFRQSYVRDGDIFQAESLAAAVAVEMYVGVFIVAV